MASVGLPPVLDLEGPPRTTWTTVCFRGKSGTDPPDESRQSPLGRARILGERLRLGLDVGDTGAGKYTARPRKPQSQTWRIFREIHVRTMVSVNFFTVPTIRFQVLYVFLVLVHERRRILHFGVMAHPKAEWTAQQLRDVFP